MENNSKGSKSIGKLRDLNSKEIDNLFAFTDEKSKSNITKNINNINNTKPKSIKNFMSNLFIKTLY